MASCVGVQIRWRRERLELFLFWGGQGPKVVISVVRHRKEKSFDREC